MKKMLFVIMIVCLTLSLSISTFAATFTSDILTSNKQPLKDSKITLNNTGSCLHFAEELFFCKWNVWMDLENDSLNELKLNDKIQFVDTPVVGSLMLMIYTNDQGYTVGHISYVDSIEYSFNLNGKNIRMKDSDLYHAFKSVIKVQYVSLSTIESSYGSDFGKYFGDCSYHLTNYLLISNSELVYTNDQGFQRTLKSADICYVIPK